MGKNCRSHYLCRVYEYSTSTRKVIVMLLSRWSRLILHNELIFMSREKHPLDIDLSKIWNTLWILVPLLCLHHLYGTKSYARCLLNVFQ